MQGKEEIFSDDASKMDMAERVFKGKMMPLLAIFFLIIIPQLFIQGNIEMAVNQVLFWVFAVMFVLYAFVFVKFGIEYTKLKKRLGR